MVPLFGWSMSIPWPIKRTEPCFETASVMNNLALRLPCFMFREHWYLLTLFGRLICESFNASYNHDMVCIVVWAFHVDFCVTILCTSVICRCDTASRIGIVTFMSVCSDWDNSFCFEHEMCNVCSQGFSSPLWPDWSSLFPIDTEQFNHTCM